MPPARPQDLAYPSIVRALLSRMELSEEALLHHLLEACAAEGRSTTVESVRSAFKTFKEAIDASNDHLSKSKHPAYKPACLELAAFSSRNHHQTHILPHLRHIISFFESKTPLPEKDDKRHLRVQAVRTLTYALVRDLYICGVYDPYCSESVLKWPLDGIYFPDLLKENVLSERNRLWWILCRNGNYDLFRHSLVRFERTLYSIRHQPLIASMGFDLVRLCIDYGEYRDAVKLLSVLEELLATGRSALSGVNPLLPDHRDSYILWRLRFNAQSHLLLHKPLTHVITDYLNGLRDLKGSESLSDLERLELHVALNRSLLRVAVRYSLRGADIPVSQQVWLRDVIDEQNELVADLSARKKREPSGFDLDTLCRAYAVLYKSLDLANDFLVRSIERFQSESVEDRTFLTSISNSWVNSNEGRVISTHPLRSRGVVSFKSSESFVISSEVQVDYMRQYWTKSTSACVTAAALSLCADNEYPVLRERLESEMEELGDFVREKHLGHAREFYLLLAGFIQGVRGRRE